MIDKDKNQQKSSDGALESLRERLASFQQKKAHKGFRGNGSSSRDGKFFTVGVELVAGVFTGVALGLFVDWVGGTSPWGLMGFFVLGSIAGFFNVYRHLNRKE